MDKYDHIVEMKHITKRFPGIIANDDVSLQIKKGEIFAILGENGAGKSTLMSMLFGMYEPDEGEIYLRGEKVKIDSPNRANELNIGMVHQHFKLVSNYTVAENIVMGCEPVKKLLGVVPVVDIKKANEEIAGISEQYGLKVNPTEVIEDMSVSARQRVEILKMLYRKAEILIFDEPTAVLTPQEIEFLLDIIRGLRDGGKTIILITHKLDEIKQIADRCAILNRGRLIDVRNVKDITTQEMAALMVGREVSFSTEKTPATPGEERLSVENLSAVNSEGFKLVDDVSFKVHAGEIFAIAGVAGNGQVEIADAIYGLLNTQSGKIVLNGEDISGMPIRARVERGISYIPEDRHVYGTVLDFDLKDNLVLKNYYTEKFAKRASRFRSDLKHDDIFKHAKKLISDYDIRSGQGAGTIVRSMSGGNQQKAIIAREIELENELMIFVQPTRGLDIGAIENIRKTIVKQRDEGKAILLVSLELDEIMDIADTIAVIYNGKFQTVQPAENLSRDQLGEYMMGVGGKANEEK